MSRFTNYILPIMLLLALSLTGGLVAQSATSHHQMHAAMMGQDNASCIAYCLSVGHLPDSVPALPAMTLLFLSAAGLFASVLYLLATARAFLFDYPAHARPSPNLIALYSHRLD